MPPFGRLLAVTAVFLTTHAGALGQGTTEPPAQGPVGEVVIVEATPDPLKLDLGKVTASRVVSPVTLEEQKGGSVTRAEVRLSRFRHENGTSHDAEFVLDRGETLDALGRSGSARGSIRVHLPIPGVYTGQLRIVHDGTVRSRHTVTVTRESVPAPLAIGDLNALLVERSCAPPSIDIKTTLRATGGAPLVLPPPAVSITKALKDDQMVGVPDASAVILDGRRKPVAATTIPTRLAPVRLRLRGLDDAGKYQVKMQFAPAGFDPVERTFTVYVKDSWGWAALFIFLGVAASFALRYYWTERRPRLLLERRAALIAGRLDQAARDAGDDQTALDVIGVLRGAISEAWRDVALNAKWSDPAPFDVPERKAALLPSWISARRLVQEAKPASLKLALEEILKPVGGALGRSATDATELATHRKTLEDFRHTYDDKVREAAIGELRKLAASYSEARPGAKPRIDTDVQKAIEDASLRLGKGDPSGALEAVEGGRLELVSIVADEIAKDLAGAPPAGFDPAAWSALKNEVEPLLKAAKGEKSADAATTRLQSALSIFVGAMRTKLAEKIAAELAANPALANVSASLTAAETKLGSGQIAAAWRDVAAAQRGYAATTTVGKAGVPMGGVPGVSGAAPAVPEALPRDLTDLLAATPALSAKGFVPPAAEDFASIQGQLTLGDWLATLAILVIATILGVKVLWSGELVWGTWTDRVVAFLWGLGLHQFSFDGIAGLTNKLRS